MSTKEHNSKIEIQADELTTVSAETQVAVIDLTTNEVKYIPLSTIQASVVSPVSTASNGLTLNGLNVELGGNLTKDTEIDLNGNELKLLSVLEDLTATIVLVQDLNGNLKSVPKSSLEADLSDVMFKSVDELITSQKYWTLNGNRNAITIDNTGGLVSGLNISNKDGVGVLLRSVPSSTGSTILVNNSNGSSGDAFTVGKQSVQNGAYNRVFNVDNVGKLTLKTVDEDLTATEVLARNTADEVVKMPISNITDGYLPLTGGTLTGNLRIIDSQLRISSSVYDSYIISSTNSGFSLYNIDENSINFRVLGKEAIVPGSGAFKVGTNTVYHEGNLNFNAWVLYGNTSTTPQNIPANTETVVSNNGGYYNTNNKITDLFNTTTNQVDLTEASVGDSLNMVLELDITTNTNNQVVYLKYRGAIGTVDEWSINITNEILYKSQGTRRMVANFNVPLEFTGDITNPGEITIISDGVLNVVTKYHSLKIN